MKHRYDPRTIGQICWWSGFVAYASITSLFQDYMGPDGMRHLIEDHWVSEWISVPFALVALVVSCVLYLASLWHLRQMREGDEP